MGTDSSSSVTLLALSTEPAHTHILIFVSIISFPLRLCLKDPAFIILRLGGDCSCFQMKTFPIKSKLFLCSSSFLSNLLPFLSLVLVEGGGGSHTNSRKCSTICILCIQPSPKNSIRCGKAKTVYLVPFLQLWTQAPSPD